MVLDALGAVAEQTLKPGRVLVVDDGSDDDTAARVAGWIAEHPDLNAGLMQLPHRGASNARSKGIEQLSAFRFLAMLDSDDLWPSDFLERAAAALREHPAAVAASADRLHERTGMDPKRRSLAGLPADPVYWMLKYGAGFSSCTLFRTKALLDVRAFQQGIPTGEDSYVFMRVAQQGDWKHVPGSPVVFRRGGGARGEEGQLSRKYPDALLQWAGIFDEFVRANPSPIAGIEDRRREALAGRWELAGRVHHERGELEKASRCYRRSIDASPALRRSFKRRLRSWRITNAEIRAAPRPW